MDVLALLVEEQTAAVCVVFQDDAPAFQQLQQQLDDTSRALAAAQAGYDQCADQDLLEYYLYEISALRAKHTYLLRQRREP